VSDDLRVLGLRARGARVGQGVYLGTDVYVEEDFAPLLTIEDGVVLAHGVCILLHDSALNNVAGEPVKFGRVTLGRCCYVGANTTVACGVTIGAGAIVGASSLVTRDVPPESVAYGQPAVVRGRVADLIAKHRGLRATSTRFQYLDLVPWRERDNEASIAVAAERIRALLEKMAK
jgi:acetyltransferase-like isoleucine patch superfamily enzyme